MYSTDTIVLGAGQAGLALSRELTAAGCEHVVLERGRVGERWRSERWDSLTLLTPNWLNRLPGSAPHDDRHGFLSRRGVIDHLEAYARATSAPVLPGFAVYRLTQAGDGFRAETPGGAWLARRVVMATGDCDVPALPAAAAGAPSSVVHLHTSRYRSPDRLPGGGVLVVGAGPSGQQIALELRRAGRPVVLATGRHLRMVRRYRGHDIWHWLDVLGLLDRKRSDLRDPRSAFREPNFALTGANGGEALDLGVLHAAGVVVAGRLQGFDGRRAHFARDASATAAEADRRMRRLLDRIEAHVATMPDRAPLAEPHPVVPVALPPGPASMDLRAAGITTVLWATGYRRSYPWLDIPVVSADGELLHRRGVTPVPGLYALGLRYQHRRRSHLIGGVGDDAAFVAAHLLRHRGARRHRPRPSAPRALGVAA